MPTAKPAMSQARDALNAALSGIIGLALDAELPRAEIAEELRRAAAFLHSVRQRLSMVDESMPDERMSIDRRQMTWRLALPE
jgi:hypothetical protein